MDMKDSGIQDTWRVADGVPAGFNQARREGFGKLPAAERAASLENACGEDGGQLGELLKAF